uniref:CNNM transmembrane domain-containing protein n=1 Tax=Zea mays TaxID=4577 RepID=A0A804Q1A7_MAIZE
MAAAAGKARAMSLAAAVRVVAATARPASSAAAAAGVGAMALIVQGEDTAFGSLEWWAYAGISFFLVLFAGIMSGLTLGLMSLGLVELEILQRSGTDAEKAQAAAILPVVQKQHQLLVTLLLCNAAAMEALPIFLDRMFHPVVAVVLSVTFVLAFGEVIPQAICTRYGLAVGANFVWLVRILMVICYPISYPIGKVLDCALGHNESALFRRAQLKALVSIHGKEAGKGGELTHDETTIISGALDLTEKTAAEAMTPIESTFSLDVDSKLDWEAIGKILARGHSRVPVYSRNPKNIIGLLLSLLTVRAETETPVSAVSIRRIPRVPSDMPLYDILNEFQKGSSHMAAVVKAKPKTEPPPDRTEPNREAVGPAQLTVTLLSNAEESADNVVVDIERPHNRQINGIPASNAVPRSSEDIEDGEVVGIITLEDVFEELLQEEIVDETDEYVDVHKRIRVAAAAAASSVARAPSVRRLTGQKAAGAQNRQGQQPPGILKKPTEGDSNSSKQVNLVEPLLEKRR